MWKLGSGSGTASHSQENLHFTGTDGEKMREGRKSTVAGNETRKEIKAGEERGGGKKNLKIRGKKEPGRP
jgi:hypothetical protein